MSTHLWRRRPGQFVPPSGWRAAAVLAALAGCLVFSVWAAPARAQFAFAVGDAVIEDEDGENSVNANQQPFLLPKQSPESTEAMEDFGRYCRRGIWEKAFRALEQASSKSQGLVARPNGVLLPTGLMVQQALADLPAAGKAAYRLFYDADARKLLSQAQGKEEATQLGKIVSTYLITSVGDIAADRLGDLYFEEGNLDGAVSAWRNIQTYRRDTSLDRALILVKLGTALARSGRWEEFRNVQRDLDKRHAGATVLVGGKTVLAQQHLAQLAASQIPSRNSETGVADFKLAESEEPLWQWRPFGRPDPNNPNPPVQFRNQFTGQNMSADMVIPVAADARAVYGNLLGYEVALDLASGKLLWRTGKYTQLLAKNNQQMAVFPDRFFITLAGNRLWTVGSAISNQNPRSGSYMKCLDTATGRELLHSKNVSDLKNWNFAGVPLVDGDRVFVTAFKSNPATELHVLLVSATNGKLKWDATIGTHKAEQFQSYSYRKSAQPSLLLRGGTLFVDTHAGALVQVDVATGAVGWGVAYESQIIKSGYDYSPMPMEMVTVGAPIYTGGLLFFKGMRSSSLTVIQPEGPTLAWRRPVGSSSMIIGADENRIYLGGEEITAYDLATRKLVWSCKVPLGTGAVRPLLGPKHIYQFSPRGIYEVDKTSGRVVRLFRGADMGSNGGAVFATPAALITSSNLAVTAYPLEGK